MTGRQHALHRPAEANDRCDCESSVVKNLEWLAYISPGGSPGVLSCADLHRTVGSST
jgi:hypothetical protein